MSAFYTGQTIGRWTVDVTLSFGNPSLVSAVATTDPSERAILQIAKRTRGAERIFKRRSRALRELALPGLPTLIEARGTDSHVFLALEPFPTDALSDRMAEGEVDWPLACTWLDRIARVLQSIHDAGWVHGGLDPHSIFIGPDDAVWMLGLECASPAGERPPIPRRSMTYVAPEVLQDADHNGPRADLYAFGCIAYELLSNEPAFAATAWAEHPDPRRMLLEWKAKTTALDPGPDHPDWIRSIVRKCTHPEPDHRLPDIDTVIEWMDSARTSWVVPEPTDTPAVVARDVLPPLVVQPSFDTDALARQLAEHAASMQADDRSTHDMLVIVSAALGVAAGLSMAVLAVIYLELSRLV
jgi:serine/threonine protein kinase